jgi:galacturan 1,4-alpha-galacturonidase
VSFKPNSTDILVQNMWCNGSHGVSVGSLGQQLGGYDIVENIYVFNASMHNTTVSLLSSSRNNPH